MSRRVVILSPVMPIWDRGVFVLHLQSSVWQKDSKLLYSIHYPFFLLTLVLVIILP